LRQRPRLVRRELCSVELRRLAGVPEAADGAELGDRRSGKEGARRIRPASGRLVGIAGEARHPGESLRGAAQGAAVKNRNEGVAEMPSLRAGESACPTWLCQD